MSDRELDQIKKEKMRRLMQGFSMPKSIVNVNTPDQFNQLTKEHPNTIIVIDFWAEWCGPCKMFGPIFEKLQQEYANQFIFAKINVDINQQVAAAFQVTGIPTTIFVKNGQMIHRIVGAANYNSMKMVLDKFSNS